VADFKEGAKAVADATADSGVGWLFSIDCCESESRYG
jgi:hypothetical protein